MSDILHIRGELWNPSCIQWTPIQLGRPLSGAVQITAEFTVQRKDGTVLHGQADDYLVINAAGELVPVPRSIGLLLFQPVIKEVKHDERE